MSGYHLLPTDPLTITVEYVQKSRYNSYAYWRARSSWNSNFFSGVEFGDTLLEAVSGIAKTIEHYWKWRNTMVAYQRTASYWDNLRQDRVLGLIRKEEDNDWYCWGWDGDTKNIDLTYCLDSMVEDLEPLSYDFRS